MSMKAYKGFNRDMTCSGFQFEEGKEYVEETAELCKSGFHACLDPIDVFNYYRPGASIYREVELEDVDDARQEDSKVSAKKIKIGAEINLASMAKASISYRKQKCMEAINNGEAVRASVGDSGYATSADLGYSTSGFFGRSTSGDKGFSVSGNGGYSTSGNGGCSISCYKGRSTSGYGGCSISGNGGYSTSGSHGYSASGNGGRSTSGYGGCSISCYKGRSTSGYGGCSISGNLGYSTSGSHGYSASGNGGRSTSGYGGCSTSGDEGFSTSGGVSITGKEGFSIAKGENCRVKGDLGAILVIIEEWIGASEIKDWKAAIVDGVNIKANTFYKLVNGELVEDE